MKSKRRFSKAAAKASDQSEENRKTHDKSSAWDSVVLYIDGMTCTNCEKRVRAALQKTDGVVSAEVRFSAGTATVRFDAARLSVSDLTDAVAAAGYSASAGLPPQKKRFLRALVFSVCVLAAYALLQHFELLNHLVPARLADSGMGCGMLFVIGLVTSVHCIAMCGGINLSQSLAGGSVGFSKAAGDGTCGTADGTASVTAQKNAETETEEAKKDGNATRHAHGNAVFIPSLLYNLGRIISYTAVGFLLGTVGLLLGGGTQAGISYLLQGVLKLLAGIFMVIMGINMSGIFPGLRRFSVRLSLPFGRKSGSRLRLAAPFAVGLLNGFMPCGPLQSMQILALAGGNPLTGALSMLCFGLGTVPLMLGLGTLVSFLGSKSARLMTDIGAGLVVVLGFAMLSQGGSLSGLFSTEILFFLAVMLAAMGLASCLPVQKPKLRNAAVGLLLCLTVAGLVLRHVNPAALLSPAADSHSNVRIVDGTQIINSTLASGKYPDIQVTSGIPVKWIIDAPDGTVNGCNYKMLIKEYDFEYTFHTGENIIEFLPEQSGVFSYSCWMGMIHGSITVTE